MFRPRSSVLALVAVSLTAVTLVGCTGSSEEPILNQFFTASRLRDNTSLDNFSMVIFDPKTEGTVSSFSITALSPEQRQPLPIKALAKAYEDAKTADQEYIKRKDVYQNDNIEAIQRVLKAKRDNAVVAAKDAAVQAAWTKMNEEGAEISKKVSEAKRRLASQSAVVELSVADPRNPIDVTKHDGDMVTKEITLTAPVRMPNGQTVRKTLVVTMQRAELKADKPIEGRWIITTVKDAAVAAGTKTS